MTPLDSNNKIRIERRRYPRTKERVPLKIKNGVDIFTQTENISCIGAYCPIDSYISPMTKLKITLLLPLKVRDKIINKKVECRGVVVRTEKTQDHPYRIAIYFNQISRSDMQKINQYVDYHRQKEETAKLNV